MRFQPGQKFIVRQGVVLLKHKSGQLHNYHTEKLLYYCIIIDGDASPTKQTLAGNTYFSTHYQHHATKINTASVQHTIALIRKTMQNSCMQSCSYSQKDRSQNVLIRVEKSKCSQCCIADCFGSCLQIHHRTQCAGIDYENKRRPIIAWLVTKTNNFKDKDSLCIVAQCQVFQLGGI